MPRRTRLDPKALARKLNRVFGAGTTAESAPYHWRDAGSLPRSPLPMAAAYVLSQELGRKVSPAELRQGRVGDSSALVPGPRTAWSDRGRLGDNDFAHTRGAARELIASRDGSQEEPRRMYFITDNRSDCQAGYGLIQLGRARQKADSGKKSRRFLAEGTVRPPVCPPSTAEATYGNPYAASDQRRGGGI
ncbi:carph-isopro domain-containing protein [Streptomyces sp. NPDC048297]|uniref:carph-isopro domain-containing protein n=1 Tax=Streptomyces sp. NPDC048297 TaxID=3365531 RepID=UPI003719C51A